MYLFDRSIRTKIVGIEKTELKEKLDIEGLIEQTKKVENDRFTLNFKSSCKDLKI